MISRKKKAENKIDLRIPLFNTNGKMSQRNSSNSEKKKNFFKRKPFIFIEGIGIGAA